MGLLIQTWQTLRQAVQERDHAHPRVSELRVDGPGPPAHHGRRLYGAGRDAGSAVGKSTELNREVLEDLWDAYDADSNGILSAEENRLLVREYLEASKVHLPKLLEESLKVSLELGMSMLD